MPLDDLSEMLKDLAIKVYLVQIRVGRRTKSPGAGERIEIASGRRKADRPEADSMRLQPQLGPSA